ncbi:uncharacterized protein J3R85_014469 [Psidium guajava]|nr:uncharacterized protein J3R85_014469 [Psidium guajava]
MSTTLDLVMRLNLQNITLNVKVCTNYITKKKLKEE